VGEVDIDAELAIARDLRATGADDAALERYMQLVRRAPTHFQILTELAELAFTAGFRSAARTAYEQAVREHPHEALGHVNLADVLIVSGEHAAAKQHLLQALVLRPGFAAAHRGLALVLAEEGDANAAERHARLGFAVEPVVDKPYRGAGAAPRILMLVSARGGNIPVDLWLNDRCYHITALYADHVDPDRPLPSHDLVFNAIGDADLCRDALSVAIRLVQRTDRPVINPPDRILPTTRAATAARFRGNRHLLTPKVTLGTIENLRARDDVAFPVLLRRPGFHTGKHFHRVDDRVGYISVLDGFARDGADEVLAIDYLDARGADGRARKYRVLFVAGRLYPIHLAVSADWKVHYFSSAMAEDMSFRAEEAAFLEDTKATIGAAGWQALEDVAATLELDYAGIDFGLDADGNILLFECNATMVLLPPGPESVWDYRRPAFGRAFAAVEAMMRNRLGMGLPESVCPAQTPAA
jgi:glutathione synthase/RimK-type ligase-like ATP-grasp enzyme